MQGETRTATSLTMSMFLRQPLVQRIVTLATGSMTCQLRWMFSSVGHLVRTYRSALKTGANFRIVSRLMFFDRTMMHIELLCRHHHISVYVVYIYIYTVCIIYSNIEEEIQAIHMVSSLCMARVSCPWAPPQLLMIWVSCPWAPPKIILFSLNDVILDTSM